MDDTRKTIEFDLRGQICPSTLLTALKGVNSHQKDLNDGEIELSIKTDHRDAVVTISDAVRNMGYYADVSRKEDYYLIIIGKHHTPK
ncbi:MAG: sulfurtransferase TusA family protein [Nitrospirae bacterium]|nr:sulfurtransferase TusA family protein [Nitrospirota bacterium]